MEVESSPGWNPPGVQIQSPFSAVASPVANPGGMGAGYLEYQMPDSPARGSTPSPVRDVTMRIRQMDGPSGRVGVVTPLSVAAWNALREAASPQMLALGELEFHRFFLIRVYLADKKIEEVLEDVNYIRYLKSQPMDCFESEIWDRFGKNFVPPSDRRKNLDWDPNKTGPLPVPAPVHTPAPSAGSNPTPGASPPPGLSPQHPTYPTYPTQPYTWAPPPSQGYSSWPGAQTQRGPRPPYWHYDSPQGSGWTQPPPQSQPQPGWCALEQGGGAGTPGDGATS